MASGLTLILALLALVAAQSFAAEIVKPEDCTEFPCLIFNDEFDFLDTTVWDHEINVGGGGNGEFQVYVNNRSVSYTRDGLLFIKPDVTANWKGEEFLSSGNLDLWGMNGIGDSCTGNLFDGCRRQGTPAEYIAPAMSARLRTQNNFAFTYGRVEVRAQMPRADWMWPAVWLLPNRLAYGGWPTSGDLDILELRTNEQYGDSNEITNKWGSCAVQWGPYWPDNRYLWTRADYMSTSGASFSDEFNVWALDWTDEFIRVSLNDVELLYVDPVTNFWEYGNFSATDDNPWAGRGKMAPFDQDFYLILSIAIGGTGGYFPDGVASVPPKAWENSSPTAKRDFWEGRDLWYPSWTQGEVGRTSENAAMKVDYIRVYKMTSAKM